MERSGQSEALLPPGEQVDLTNCDREPIHIPGSIQPHGILLGLREPDLIVTHASANGSNLLGRGIPDRVLEQPLDTVLEPTYVSRLQQFCRDINLENNPIYAFRAPLDGGVGLYDWVVHRSEGTLILEGEPAPVFDPSLLPSQSLTDLAKRAVPRLQKAPNAQTLYQTAAEEVRLLTGFDRVMLYRFDEEGHGSVVAEDKREDLEPFLNLHYPASDIPKQARRLYTLSLLRLIADVNYTPSPVLTRDSSTSLPPLDMSYCALRSVSPIHIEYLKNMGVAASMSISVLQDGELWGLIACHHYAGPRMVPFEVRSACELLGQVVSQQLAAKEDSEDDDYRSRMWEIQSKLVEQMAVEPDYRDGLVHFSTTMQDLLNCGGCALRFELEPKKTVCIRLGTTPSEEEIDQIITFLADREKPESIFATDRLPTLLPEAEAFRAVGSGLLALPLLPRRDNPIQGTYLLWFRPEQVQTVDWAGDPNKPALVAEDNSIRLSPRKSFAKWKEEVHGRSLPWTRGEVEIVGQLSRAIQGVIFRKAAELAQVNTALAYSNAELDSFVYIASHDLKEPLRGIHNYVQFLQEDHREELSEDALSKIGTITRLSRRMESLLDSLLHYSRVGRLNFSSEPADFNTILSDTLEMLSTRIRESGTAVRKPRPLPTGFLCDPLQISEVFSNLISNACKYNDYPPGERWVEVGYFAEGEESMPPLPPDVEKAPIVFYIRDNGIGIPERHQETIFRIFRRLHGRQDYGGGTGAGLTIARKIVERHGGKLWLTSIPKEGTTFFFTLAGEETS